MPGTFVRQRRREKLFVWPASNTQFSAVGKQQADPLCGMKILKHNTYTGCHNYVPFEVALAVVCGSMRRLGRSATDNRYLRCPRFQALRFSSVTIRFETTYENESKAGKPWKPVNRYQLSSLSKGLSSCKTTFGLHRKRNVILTIGIKDTTGLSRQ